MSGTPGMRQDSRPRFVAVGDVALGDSPTCTGFGFRSRYSNEESIRRWADHVRVQLGEADVVLGNLEGVISDAGMRLRDWRSFQLRGRPTYARFLKQAGFTALHVANNHTFQHGQHAFNESVALLESHGMAVVGLRGSAPWTCRPARIEACGRSIGLLGYCFRPRQYSDTPPPYAEGDLESLCADVRRLKAECDFAIVSLHWGEEFVPVPSREEAQKAEAIVAAGADVIVGHHPHVLRDLQRMGSAVVAYSLGNYTGDMIWHEPLRTGGLLRCALGAGVPEASLQPVRVGADFLPRPEGPAREPVAQVEPLDEQPYAEEVRRTVRAQQLDSYAYALRHLHRFPAAMLAQLAGTTLRNKLAAFRGTAQAREPRNT